MFVSVGRTFGAFRKRFSPRVPINGALERLPSPDATARFAPDVEEDPVEDYLDDFEDDAMLVAETEEVDEEASVAAKAVPDVDAEAVTSAEAVWGSRATFAGAAEEVAEIAAVGVGVDAGDRELSESVVGVGGDFDESYVDDFEPVEPGELSAALGAGIKSHKPHWASGEELVGRAIITEDSAGDGGQNAAGSDSVAARASEKTASHLATGSEGASGRGLLLEKESSAAEASQRGPPWRARRFPS